MKNIITISLLFFCGIISAQRGYFKPSYMGWPTDSSAWLTMKWNPDINKVAWVEDGIGNDSAIFDIDTVCITQMGVEYCVSLDSIYYTDTTLCWIILPDTSCISWSSTGGNIYNMDGTFTGARIGELGSNSLRFTEGGVTRFRLNHNATSPGELLTLTENYTNASQSMLALSNGSSGADSDALMRFQSTGASGRHYSLGVDRSASAFTFAENNNLGTGAWMRYYGDGDSLVIEPLTLAAGSGLRLRSNNTTAASNTQKLFEANLLGANATPSQTTYAGYFSNLHTGTGPVNYGVYGVASGSGGLGAGVYGTSASGSMGVVGTSVGSIGVAGSSTNSIGVSGTTAGGSGIGVYADGGTAGDPFWATLNSASTGSAQRMMLLDRECSGTPANGIGGLVELRLPTSTTGSVVAGNITWQWSDVTHASRTSYLTFNVVANGTTTPGLTLQGDRTALFAGRVQPKQGADVASVAGAIVLGHDGNIFEITGTNAITLISNLDWQNGSEITLLFTSTSSLTDGTANSGTDIGMELQGNANFTGSADDLITLVLCEIGGTQRWREKSRSVN